MSEDEQTESINYELLVEDSLRTVVRSALALVQHEGLLGNTHFYISFKTNHPQVQIDDGLKAANPAEMTIVLQHQFWDLEVYEQYFSVSLSFSGARKTLVIPYSAITHFTDPSVGFGLQFSDQTEELSDEDSNEAADETEAKTHEDTPPSPVRAVSTTQAPDDGEGAQIVSLDTFRKKPEQNS